MNTAKRKILLVYRALDSSTRLCGYSQLRYLQDKNLIEFHHGDIFHLCKRDLDWCDLLVMVRGDSPLFLLAARLCHNAGKKFVYVLDDDLLNVPQQFSCGPFYAEASVQNAINTLIETCDYFASPSCVLQDKYGKDRIISIIEPALMVVSNKEKKNSDVVRIGFAGSKDRGIDMDSILTESLIEITRKYQDKISIEIFGTDTELSKRIPCEVLPYMNDYQAYQKKMCELQWDIGLAPMPDTEFHRCKHYNKLVEYSGFGIAGIFSNVTPYCEIVEDHVNGILCENSKDAWVEAISELIENPQLRSSIAQSCISQARTVFTLENAAEELLQQLNKIEILPYTRISPAIFYMEKMKITGVWVIQKLKTWGWRAPWIILKKIKDRL